MYACMMWIRFRDTFDHVDHTGADDEADSVVRDSLVLSGAR